MPGLAPLRERVEGVEREAADGVTADLAGRIVRLRVDLTEAQTDAQSAKDRREATALLNRLKSVYAP